MGTPAFQIIDRGLGATLQDSGRWGWRRFGVPPSGPMDDHAAQWGNRLLDNPPEKPVIELLLQGAHFHVLHDLWVTITGADGDLNLPAWRAIRCAAGSEIRFGPVRSGLWRYLAVAGGFIGEQCMGSVSTYPRAGLGTVLNSGSTVDADLTATFDLPPGVAGRTIASSERRDFRRPPVLRVWPGPEPLPATIRRQFFDTVWTVSPQSDRTGYRLNGEGLQVTSAEMISEPVIVGTIQLPPNGLPIVTMRDGPTVGGYPKIGLVDPADLSWLTQCMPGQSVRFQPYDW